MWLDVLDCSNTVCFYVMNNKEEALSSGTFNIDLVTGNVTLPVVSGGASVAESNPLPTLPETGRMLPPLTSDVPSSSKGYTGKVVAPGKVKVKKVLEKNSEEYLMRRQRNNVAVKKSREKIRERSEYTLQKVEQLKVENEHLESKIATLTKELGVLKDLFMEHARGFCTGGNTNMLTAEQLETLLGCKVIRGRDDGAGPSSSTAGVSCSTIEPLINAAEIELIAFGERTINTIDQLPEQCSTDVKQVVVIDDEESTTLEAKNS